jgi:hypothetical protein
MQGAREHFAGLPPFRVAGLYQWTAASTLEMKLRYIDSRNGISF